MGPEASRTREPGLRIAVGSATAAVRRIETGGSFLTGVEFAAMSYRAEGRAALAGVLADAGERLPFRAATPEGPGSHHFYSVEGAIHGAEVVSPALITLDPGWLMERCAPAAEPPGWHLSSATLDVYDFGVGTAVLSWTPDDAETDAESLPQSLEFLDHAATLLLEGLVGEAAVLDRATQGHPLRRESPLREGSGDGLPAAGALLWIWNHCLLATDRADVPSVARTLGGRICPNDVHAIDHRDHTYAGGVYASVTCSASGCEEDAVTLSRAIASQDAWWTLFWFLDRRLVALLVDLDHETPSGLAGVKERMASIAAVSDRVGLYRSRLESILVSSGARDIAVWNCLARAWDLDFRVQVVDRKLAQLQGAYTRTTARLSDARAVRIAIMVYVFTALSLISVAVTVVQYAEAGVNDSLGVRLLVLALSGLAAVAAVGASLRVKEAVADSRRARRSPD